MPRTILSLPDEASAISVVARWRGRSVARPCGTGTEDPHGEDHDQDGEQDTDRNVKLEPPSITEANLGADQEHHHQGRWHDPERATVPERVGKASDEQHHPEYLGGYRDVVVPSNRIPAAIQVAASEDWLRQDGTCEQEGDGAKDPECGSRAR